MFPPCLSVCPTRLTEAVPKRVCQGARASCAHPSSVCLSARELRPSCTQAEAVCPCLAARTRTSSSRGSRTWWTSTCTIRSRRRRCSPSSDFSRQSRHAWQPPPPNTHTHTHTHTHGGSMRERTLRGTNPSGQRELNAQRSNELKAQEDWAWGFLGGEEGWWCPLPVDEARIGQRVSAACG
jgi:hypothetical protein